MLEVREYVPRRPRPDQLVELQLDRLAVAVLRNPRSRGAWPMHSTWMLGRHPQAYAGLKCSNATETPGDQAPKWGRPSAGTPAAVERSSFTSATVASNSGQGSWRTTPHQRAGPAARE